VVASRFATGSYSLWIVRRMAKLKQPQFSNIREQDPAIGKLDLFRLLLDQNWQCSLGFLTLSRNNSRDFFMRR
jgi:hypothetical protein